MRKVPWWLFLIIAYFVYDDIWYTEAEHPWTHYSLTIVLVIVLAIFALGKGDLVQELISWAGNKIPF